MAERTLTLVPRDGSKLNISNLPDDVLVRILSFVPAEQALATSILSKRWKSVWTLLPTLNLDFIQFSERFGNLSLDVRKRRFLEFVEHVLFLRNAEQLPNLRLAFNINEFKDYSLKLRLLVRSVMTSNCSALDLDFPCRNVWCLLLLYPDNHEVYTLPRNCPALDLDFPCRNVWCLLLLYPDNHEVYTFPRCSFSPHKSVTNLTLTHCEFIPSLYKSFRSIKIVKLKSVRLGAGSVYDLVSKSPCLQELHLVTCEFRSSSFELHVQESDLKCLVFQSCSCTDDIEFKSFSINIPSLLQFKYVGCIEGPVLSENGGSSLLTPFCNLKHLIVKVYPELVDEELLGLMCLLRNTPCLEKLSVEFHPYIKEWKDTMISSVYNENGGTSLESHLLPSEGVSHLMKIDIKNFQGLKSEMGFVRIMLQKSPRLKEMFLMNGIGEEHFHAPQKQKDTAIQNLLACARVSPDAEIFLK
ncbi:hypothetical protein MKW98_005471 [Papaver atlanticum]|uniref:F-box domain-containing protein n=1 Tax=Papaver atlanticum TaxID=357466 RepID=A0AAD4XTC4_9MAGN|nr:hypothetical protein MKW98_005471 [Papaver atlanticum]